MNIIREGDASVEDAEYREADARHSELKQPLQNIATMYLHPPVIRQTINVSKPILSVVRPCQRLIKNILFMSKIIQIHVLRECLSSVEYA